jgi:hypothetical protein
LKIGLRIYPCFAGLALDWRNETTIFF